MNVIYQFSEQQIQQVHQLYKTVWWAKERSLEETTACINGSQICIGIVDDNDELIAFTRILSDFIYKAIIFDLIVCELQRGNGIGQKMIGLIKNHTQLKKVKHFELYCLPEMEPFYANFGFSTDVGGIKLMRCVDN